MLHADMSRIAVRLLMKKLYGLHSGLVERVQNSKHPLCYPKMIIIIPRSCECPGDVHALDSNFTHVGYIPHSHTRSGNVQRDYRSSVYDFTYKNADGTEVMFLFIEQAEKNS
jgi:hypothetical protein